MSRHDFSGPLLSFPTLRCLVLSSLAVPYLASSGLGFSVSCLMAAFVLYRLVSSCLVSSRLVSSCLVPSRLDLCWPGSSYTGLSVIVPNFLVNQCPGLVSLILSSTPMSCHILSWHVLSCLVVSCRVAYCLAVSVLCLSFLWSCPILSCPVLSGLDVSSPASSSLVYSSLV